MNHDEKSPELIALEARMMSGEPFTYGELCRLPGVDERQADRMIQRWRKRGWIEFTRIGSGPVWSMTDAGRAQLAKEAGQ